MVFPCLIDTDTLSAIFRGHPGALAKSREYLEVHKRYSFSLITRYEILRGLKARNAVTQLERFEKLCAVCEIVPITDAVIIRASGIYADLYQQGKLIGDADILIAASAIENDLILVTNNVSHFERVEGLPIENWLEAQP
jgi:tRNA(fMet)-specific endonuclease VapC